ncbi:MAG: nucleotidyltransferase family protein [Proteobacteria bacterium]|mgnify:CR=1 FL=1|nr:nucleotidyltransferase family protein [Pseudomonadota bacterium]
MNPAQDPIAAVLLAAGAGSRFGHRPKSLLQRDGQPLLARQIALLAQAGLERIVVVLGHHAEQLAPVVQAAHRTLPTGVKLESVRNPNPDVGPGSSLRTGLAALGPELQSVMVLLADQPLLQAADIVAVQQAWRARGEGVDLVMPTHEGQPGHPLVFGRALRQWLTEHPDTTGVRDWRRTHPERVQALPVDHPRTTCDIDTEADLQALAAEHGVQLHWPDPAPAG